MQSAHFFFHSILPVKPCCQQTQRILFTWHSLLFGNSHDLITVFEKQLILMILQSYLDILCANCLLKQYLLPLFTGKLSSIWGQMGNDCITQSVHRSAHSNLCKISMIYEPSGFAFQLHMKVIPVQWKDDWGRTPFLVIFFFSCQWFLRECTCPS